MRNLVLISLILFFSVLSCKEEESGDKPVINSFTATLTAITAGESTTLAWTVDNAETLSLNQNIGSVSGSSQNVSPLVTTTYTLKAENQWGIDSAQVIVTVAPDPNTHIVTVNFNNVRNPSARKLLGITFDARSSMNNGNGISIGYHDMNTGTMLPAMQPLWARIPLTGTRYPGNAVTYNWNWKLTVGPQANRVAQTLSPNSSEKLSFGFDEFMSMVEARGLTGSDVQIMVNIYDIANEVSPAQNAADWVEYCNAPNNGSNPGGGTDWAAQRAANGHANPYNVRIWNIGNEPWGPTEYNFDATFYIPKAVAIIDAMKAIDPNLQITIPAVGNPTSGWNSAILTSASLNGKFWGLSPHFFYDEDAATNNPNILQDETLLKALETTSLAKGLKLIIGDHAHDAPFTNQDKGFQWEGALATADFLTMASQVTNIDRGNYWIYGSWKAQWHPIRRNNDGSFTFMAAAQVYEEFYPVMFDKSVLTSLSLASGGSVASVRAAAFQSNDAQKASVIVVNIDRNNSKKIGKPSLTGYTVSKATVLTGNLTDDSITKSTITAQADNTYSLPTISVLILEFIKN